LIEWHSTHPQTNSLRYEANQVTNQTIDLVSGEAYIRCYYGQR